MSATKLLAIASIILTGCSGASNFDNLRTRTEHTIHGKATVFFDAETGKGGVSATDPQNVGIMGAFYGARDAVKNYKK